MYITTTPAGASVALIPIDPKNNEPDTNPSSVIRPKGKTPFTIELKAATYLVEASLSGTEDSGFAEVYRTVPDFSKPSDAAEKVNSKLGVDPDTTRFRDIRIQPPAKLIDGMVKVEISEAARRKNPSLPAALYVDSTQTGPDDLKPVARFREFLMFADGGETSMSYSGALRWAEANQVRLPSAAEYDAIVDAVKNGNARFAGSGGLARMADLFDDVPEFSTTTISTPTIRGNGVTNHLQGKHILKGVATGVKTEKSLTWVDGSLLAEPNEYSPRISIRGVRSATPRFVKP